MLALQVWELRGTLLGALGLAALLAAGAALGLLIEMYRRQQIEAGALEALNRQMLATLDVRELTGLISREGSRLIGADGVGIATVADDGVLVVSTASRDAAALGEGEPLPLDGSLTGWCIRTGEPCLANHAARDPRAFQPAVRAAGATGVATKLTTRCAEEEKAAGSELD